ncbi:hypothetical protein RclHR1_01360006 [Rhizophagus clarus]|uniref:F-box domain-containing protein n=1 Tax=Rhizophagus clarus TaxID=94130 RepID=A0A2Z6QCA9_9GLOM|nr:hypothetical protein RclHR1_01360006 [Rhizophagus clarus]
MLAYLTNKYNEVFNQLNFLESVHIFIVIGQSIRIMLILMYRYFLLMVLSFFQQINNISKPFKLKSLFLSQILEHVEPVESIKLLIQKPTNTNDLKIFLKNSQNTFIKKLSIYIIIKNNVNESIFPYMEEYIMKKKRIKYLTILESHRHYGGKDEDLFFLKDKVKEFQLHDVQILNYYANSYFNLHDFIKKLLIMIYI